MNATGDAFDCMTMWTIRAAKAAGLEQETLCAIMAEAQALAEAHPDDGVLVRDEMRKRWKDVILEMEPPPWSSAAWVLYVWEPMHCPVPVAFSPTGWEAA